MAPLKGLLELIKQDCSGSIQLRSLGSNTEGDESGDNLALIASVFCI